MSSFNEYFKNQGADIIVNRFFNATDIYNPKAKLTSLKWHIADDPVQPASYYIENELTAVFRVILDYTINDDPTIYQSYFEVPREIDGAFILEGAYRINTNRMGSDYDCRIKMSGTGEHIVNFDFMRRYDIKKGVLKMKDQDNPFATRWKTEIPFDKIDSYPDREALKLTEYQSKKFQIKLDLNYVPEYITQQLIQECLAFGDDRLKDLIIDKTVESVPVAFMQYLFRSNNKKNYYSARKRITSYWTKNSKLQDEIRPISTLAFRFFKGDNNSKGDSNLQIASGVNAINLQSVGSKIVIPETVAFNNTFSDLIDIVDTPINQNTNLQNALTVSTRITDEGVMFKVMTKDWAVVEIPYIDYLNSKVCASEYLDYNTNTIKPDDKGQVEVKYRMKRIMVPVEEVELLDLHPDYRLSETTRRIPFINYTDSVRMSMGTSMLKQSIPLVHAQRPLVDTGNSMELDDNILNERFNYPEGKVKDITEDKVIIELPDKSEVDVLRRTAIQSINDVSVYTQPKVKKGQTVKKGDIITGAVGLGDNTYKAGLNTLVLFHAEFGLVNEDALVVSESYANRMAHYSIIDLTFNVKNSAALKWVVPIGTRVKSGDSIVTFFKAVRLDEINKALNDKLGGLFGEQGKDLTEYTVEGSMKVPNNIDEAYVSDVIFQEMKNPTIPKSVKKPDYSFSRQSEHVISEYESTKDRKIIYDKFPEYIASDRLDPIIMDSKDYKVVYTVRIRLIKKTILMVGSKVTNRYGGKGVVSKVFPDELMPIMVEKGTGKQYRVEVVMNPYSTINRKIAGVLLEQSLGNIAHKLYDLVDEYRKTKTGQKKIMPLLEKYYPGRYTKMDVEDFIKLHETKPIEEVYYFNVGCFSDFTPAKVQGWMEDLGLESQSEILMPSIQVTDMDELKENLSEEEYDKIVKNLQGKYTKVDKPLQVGWMTLEELYHIPSYSNKVTTSLYGVDISPRKDEPILGKGRYRTTGQKIGEMELSVLLARNAKDYINEARNESAKEQNQLFLNNLLGLGMAVKNDAGYNQGGSSLKSDLNKMKTKFRLKNQK